MIVSSVQNFSTKNNIPNRSKGSVSTGNIQILIKDEVSFGSKRKKSNEQKIKKLEEEISNINKDELNANDGINDIDNNSLKTSKSDLNTAKDGLSMQEFDILEQNEALKKQDLDSKLLKELDNIDIPKIDIPDLELENLDKDIGKISEDIDKSFKSSMFKSIFAEVGIGVVVIGAIYYFLKKNKKQNKNLDKHV